MPLSRETLETIKERTIKTTEQRYNRFFKVFMNYSDTDTAIKCKNNSTLLYK